jgi:glyoxylase-like metal-dependent hydrolase (beta-lactamase superfamily II)/rhodanese-related sulfurtransferase
MLLKHYFIEKIAHSSYILAGSNACAVIDPSRDVDLYITEARKLGVDITHILETHLHADFVSGHIELARRTGAKIYMPEAGKCAFDHVPLSEGDVLALDNIELEVLETPGHSPESVCYVVTDTSRGEGPLGVFTGDTLFVGDVGRPDLFPNRAQELAEELYHSLEKLLQLPDYCEVYPAHGAGSLCGRTLNAKWRTTIGYEREYNQALQIKDKGAFIRSLTSNMPPAPDHFSRCNDINRQGPALISDLPVLEELDPSAFKEHMNASDVMVVDVRNYDAFGSQHVPGAWHIALNGNFPTFAGWVLPPEKDILLVAGDDQDASQANLWARRVGLDRVVAYLEGGMIAWAVAGQRTSSVGQISAADLHDMVRGKSLSEFVLVDVRSTREFQDTHIEGVVNIPAPELRTRFKELEADKPTVMICSSGHRGSLGASILKQHGFRDVYNVAGGMTGYSAAGYTKECTVCENPHGSRQFADILEA